MPEDVTPDQLDKNVRRDLMSLSKVTAEQVARHLVMASRLLETDPEAAYQHAMAAQAVGGRVGAVREAAGLSAYAAGHFAEALAELRAARRITGDDSYWPVMADCERGLGRPERAIAMAAEPEVARLDHAGQVEMRIVVSGARRDLGQYDAAVLTLQGADLTSRRREPWTARLHYAYADALLTAGRRDEALAEFLRVAELDTEGETDAADRAAELEGISFLDAETDDDEGPGADDAGADPAVLDASDRTDVRPYGHERAPASDGTRPQDDIEGSVTSDTSDEVEQDAGGAQAVDGESPPSRESDDAAAEPAVDDARQVSQEPAADEVSRALPDSPLDTLSAIFREPDDRPQAGEPSAGPQDTD